jgi:hypothetical protein
MSAKAKMRTSKSHDRSGRTAITLIAFVGFVMFVSLAGGQRACRLARSELSADRIGAALNVGIRPFATETADWQRLMIVRRCKACRPLMDCAI